MLDLFKGGRLVGSYPITPGSEHLPAPKGEWIIEKIAWNPPFRWDKEMLMKGKRGSNAFNLPPGPNSPVGILWMQLNKPGIGIHGTAEPETIGRSASHGCIRLANWDAFDLGQKVQLRTPVTIR
jgi:lipoprotein-anchoring transpeptidase ErfK/SrfK